MSDLFRDDAGGMSIDAEVLNAVQGPALTEALGFRIEQIMKHGHSRATDAQRPIDWLVREAVRRLQAAADQVSGPRDRVNLVVGRRNVLKAAMMALAAADRIQLDQDEADKARGELL